MFSLHVSQATYQNVLIIICQGLKSKVSVVETNDRVTPVAGRCAGSPMSLSVIKPRGRDAASDNFPEEKR